MLTPVSGIYGSILSQIVQLASLQKKRDWKRPALRLLSGAKA